ncbi:unnamed protein product [Pylaiella littoralis]
MFRSLFGTPVAGEDGSSTGASPRGGVGSNVPGQQQQQQQQDSRRGGGISGSATDIGGGGGGGFFQLEQASAGREESLFDDLEVKPPAKDAKPPPMKAPPETESTGGVFSAFQFMANSASDTNDAAPRTGNTSALSASPTAEVATKPKGGDEAASGGLEMSAFSFLTDDSRAENVPGTPSGGGGGGGGEVGGDPELDSEPKCLPRDVGKRTPLSSFSFLTEGGDWTAAAAVEGATGSGEDDQQQRASAMPSLSPSSSSTVAAAAAAAAGGVLPTSSDSTGVGTSAHVGAGDQRSVAGGGSSGSGLQTRSLVSGASSPFSSSQGMAPTSGSGAAVYVAAAGMSGGGGVAAEEGVPHATARGIAARTGAGSAAPSWKPSAGVVRKKRPARRVGYARDGAPSYSSPAAPLSSSSSSSATKEPAVAAGLPSPLSSPTARNASGGAAASAGSAKPAAGGGGPSNTNPSASDMAGPSRPVVATAAVGGGGGGGGGGISYVPDGEGAPYEAPPVSFQSRTPPARRGSGEGGAMDGMDDSLVAEAAAMAALAASMAPGEIQGATSLTKGDLKQGSSHGTSSSSTSSAAGGGHAAGTSSSLKKNKSFMRKFKGLLGHSSSRDARESKALSLEEERDAADAAATATSGSSGTRPAAPSVAEEEEEEKKEGAAIQEMRRELSLLVNAFQEKSKSLSNRLTEVASEKAALECSRTSVGNAYAEGIRRLAEAESEQQRLADVEDYEKAAELSVEIESLREDTTSAARQLRELEEDEVCLDRSSMEARSDLLSAVAEAALGFKAFKGRQDAKLGKLVSKQADLLETEKRRMNTEQERIALEKTHVERDWAHLEEELSQTEQAISVQTGGEDERMSKLRLMKMELEGEVKELEAQLEAKRGALREVVVGLGEAEGRISAVRSKFERQLQRLRERERLVEVSRQDCRREEAVLQADRDSHREHMEQATQEQQCFLEALEGVAAEVKLAEMLQSTLANHWRSEPRIGGRGRGGTGTEKGVRSRDGDGDGDSDARDDALTDLRSEVEAARSRYELKARAVTALEERKEELTTETKINIDALPGLEQKKKAAVSAKNYKEAGHVSRQIKETERRQQEVSELLSELEQSVAEGSTARKELHESKTDLTHTEEALRVAEEAVAVSKVAALEKRAKPVRKAGWAVRHRGKAGGLRDAAESLLLLQLSSLDAEAKDISARHGLAPPELSQPRPGDSDDDDDDDDDVGDADDGGGGDGDGGAAGSEATAGAADERGDAPVGADGLESGDKIEASPPEAAAALETDQGSVEENPALLASRELIKMESAEVERDLAGLDARLAKALEEEDYDEAAELDFQVTQVRARLADFAAQAAALTQPTASGGEETPADGDSGGSGSSSSVGGGEQQPPGVIGHDQGRVDDAGAGAGAGDGAGADDDAVAGDTAAVAAEGGVEVDPAGAAGAAVTAASGAEDVEVEPAAGAGAAVAAASGAEDDVEVEPADGAGAAVAAASGAEGGVEVDPEDAAVAAASGAEGDVKVGQAYAAAAAAVASGAEGDVEVDPADAAGAADDTTRGANDDNSSVASVVAGVPEASLAQGDPAENAGTPECGGEDNSEVEDSAALAAAAAAAAERPNVADLEASRGADEEEKEEGEEAVTVQTREASGAVDSTGAQEVGEPENPFIASP